MSLSPEEHAELQRLLTKASAGGVPPSLSLEDSGTKVRDSDDQDSGFSLIPFEHPLAAMTDASKRREDDSSCVPNSKRERGGTGLSAYPKFVTPPTSPPGLTSYAGGSHMPPPMPKSTHVEGLPDIPEDISSLEQWGKSLIQFGQYKATGWSYEDLASATDDRAVSYVKWVKARAKSSTGLLHDLACFLVRFQAERDIARDLAWDGPCIPGTDVHRTFKK